MIFFNFDIIQNLTMSLKIYEKFNIGQYFIKKKKLHNDKG